MSRVTCWIRFSERARQPMAMQPQKEERRGNSVGSEMKRPFALYTQSWAATRRYLGDFNKINKLTGRPPPAPEARGGQSLTKDQFVIAISE